MKIGNLAWLILFLPLIASMLITLVTRRHRGLSAGLSIGAITASFLLTLVVLASEGWNPLQRELGFVWLEVGVLQVDFGIILDPLSLLMLLVVTGVGSAIHFFSWGYMKEDPSVSRFFAGLSLFTFSMIGIVVSNNFLQMFIFWELVGVSSYLLIGFWYEKPSAADAGKKAFITNRLGDFGFLLGILIIWSFTQGLNFTLVAEAVRDNPALFGSLTSVVGILIFCGAVGKSAQFPLHVWLPDAMEGPTPVSALIHAATMVAAGVYLLCRVFFIFDPLALSVIAWIGAITALLAALIALQQNDIKRILAYSTLSQLGYMVMAVGVAAPAAAMFHLTTHAFFKALLFLGAGSVIHALHHEQDIWRMGGLKKRMPITYWTFLLATLALAGVPPLSGFFSKDSILAAAGDANTALLVIGLLVALGTSFYMFRLFLVAFEGEPRTPEAGHAHESPSIMTGPLLVLCLATVGGAFVGLDQVMNRHFKIPGSEESHGFLANLLHPFSHAPLAAFGSLGVLVVGLCFAWYFYRGASRDPLPVQWGAFSRALRNRLYFDEFYRFLNQNTHEFFSRLAQAADQWVIAGLMVRGFHGTTEILGRTLRLLQSGNLQTYAAVLGVGVIVLLYYFIWN